MTTETDERPLRAVICEVCSNRTGEFSRETRFTVGPCCSDLPAPWDQSHDEDDDEPDRRPTCDSCGGHRFTASVTRSMTCDARHYDYDDSVLGIDEDDASVDTAIHCYDCGVPFDGDWCWA